MRRTIENSATGQRGSFVGVADFSPDSSGAGFLSAVGGLVWTETGTLTWPGYTGPATRTLYIEPDADSPSARVSFDDGRFFHILDIESGRCDIEHPCEPDHYVGEFIVASPEQWRTRWLVRGPAKALTIETWYRRP